MHESRFYILWMDVDVGLLHHGGWGQRILVDGEECHTHHARGWLLRGVRRGAETANQRNIDLAAHVCIGGPTPPCSILFNNMHQ